MNTVASAAARGVDDAPDAGVDGLERADRRLQLAGVADHVRVCVVDQDERGAAGLERFEDAVGHRRRRHLGRQIVGRDVAVRRHQPPLFTSERLLDATVEEVGDVRVFLGLGGAQLRHALLRQHFAQDHREALGCKRRRHVQLPVVAGHGRESGELRPRRAIEVREVRVAGVKSQRQLARAVGAEVEEETRVAVLDDRAVLLAHQRRDEFVGQLVVALLDGVGQIVDGLDPYLGRASTSATRPRPGPSACRDPSRSSDRPPTPAARRRCRPGAWRRRASSPPPTWAACRVRPEKRATRRATGRAAWPSRTPHTRGPATRERCPGWSGRTDAACRRSPWRRRWLPPASRSRRTSDP